MNDWMIRLLPVACFSYLSIIATELCTSQPFEESNSKVGQQRAGRRLGWWLGDTAQIVKGAGGEETNALHLKNLDHLGWYWQA